MSRLLFKPRELEAELESLKELAEEYLKHDSIYILDELVSSLRGLVADGGRMLLEIPRNRPLTTRISEGEFEPVAKSSGRRIYGEVTGKWEVMLQRVGKRKKLKLIEFCGIASTVVELFDHESRDLPIATWKVELGDANAPGCYFHSHAGSLTPDLPIPRHPSLFPTPMAAIAFALGELFQHKWEQTVAGITPHPNHWRSLQKRRLKALLKWKLHQIETGTSSPWIALKSAKPSPNLFVPEIKPIPLR